MRVSAVVLFLAGMLAVSSFSDAQPPGGKDDKEKFGKGGFPGGFGRGQPGQPGQLMPAFVQEALKLTDAQKKDLEALQRDVDEKIGKILTDDQKKQLKEMRERGPGGFGPGGGFPGGKGGFPGGRGEKKGDKKE